MTMSDLTTAGPIDQRINPYHLPAATHSYLARAGASLAEAVESADAPRRYAAAHVAALQAAAALLAARAEPAPAGRRQRQRNAWVLLARAEPALAGWARLFAGGAAKRAAAEAGSTKAVTEDEARELVRTADRFLAVIEQTLGLTTHLPYAQHPATSGWSAAEQQRAG